MMNITDDMLDIDIEEAWVETYEEEVERIFFDKAPVNAIVHMDKLELLKDALNQKIKQLKQYYHAKEMAGEQAALKHIGYMAEANTLFEERLKDIK